MSGNHDEIQTDEEYNNTLTDMFPSELDFAKELDSFKEDLNLDEEDEFDYDDYLNNHYDDEDDEIEEEIDDVTLLVTCFISNMMLVSQFLGFFICLHFCKVYT